MHETTITSWALLVSKALAHYGHDSDAVFRRVGLDPSKLNDPGERYPYAGMTRLWNAAVDLTGDQCFGLTAAGFWHPTTLHALGYSWFASARLKYAFERLRRYVRIVSTTAKAELNETGRVYEIVITNVKKDPPPAWAAIDAGLAVLMEMCRASWDESLRPLRVKLERKKPACADRFSEFYGADVEYSAPVNALYFDKSIVEKLLPTGNAELVRANDKIIHDYLAHWDRSQIALQVRKRLIEQLPSGRASEYTVARGLNLSPRTLQRKLREEGTTYKNLLEETRRELANQYIENSRLSINEITYLLGFSEPSNFTRAFKRWHGVSPTAYRAGR